MFSAPLCHQGVGAGNLCVKRDIVNGFINRTAASEENFAASDKILDKNIIFVIINVKIQFAF
ncbi:hypothetical protein B2G52_07225 [Neisseria lactamica]|uniref:Uncharacterized protein n=1 Tax=Neisseria lactamica TaxID=486 RepID=A0AAU8VT91_NEILA|nr:hypothetical protein B2G52_07225 [Neisseria lactamica]